MINYVVLYMNGCIIAIVIINIITNGDNCSYLLITLSHVA